MSILGPGSTGFPQILYPSTPPVPSAPSLSQVASGSQSGRTEYFKVTYETPYGESAASSEAHLAIGANEVAVVAPPGAISSATPVTGFNVYGSTSAGTEIKQNASPISLKSSWQEPAGGLVGGGAAPPAAWAYALLNFQRPARLVPYGIVKPVRTLTRSYAGLLQAYEQYVENLLRFTMEWIGAGSDVAAWLAFLEWAASGAAFDYYPQGGAPGGGFTSYWWLEDNKELKFKSVGQFTTALEFTQAIF